MAPNGTQWYPANQNGTHWNLMSTNGTKGNLMVPNNTEWYWMVRNGTERYQMVPNGTKWWQMVPIVSGLIKWRLEIQEKSKLRQILQFCSTLSEFTHLVVPRTNSPPKATKMDNFWIIFDYLETFIELIQLNYLLDFVTPLLSTNRTPRQNFHTQTTHPNDTRPTHTRHMTHTQRTEKWFIEQGCPR